MTLKLAIIPDGACPGSSPHASTTTNRLALCFRTDFEPMGAFGRPGASDTEIACLGTSSQSPRPSGVAYWPHNRREGRSQQRNDAFFVCSLWRVSTLHNGVNGMAGHPKPQAQADSWRLYRDLCELPVIVLLLYRQGKCVFVTPSMDAKQHLNIMCINPIWVFAPNHVFLPIDRPKKIDNWNYMCRCCGETNILFSRVIKGIVQHCQIATKYEHIIVKQFSYDAMTTGIHH